MAEAASQNSVPQSPCDLQSVHSTAIADNNEIPRPIKEEATADKSTVNISSKILWMKGGK